MNLHLDLTTSLEGKQFLERTNGPPHLLKKKDNKEDELQCM